MRVDPRTKAAGMLEEFLKHFDIPIVGYLRTTQNYVNVAAAGNLNALIAATGDASVTAAGAGCGSCAATLASTGSVAMFVHATEASQIGRAHV